MSCISATDYRRLRGLAHTLRSLRREPLAAQVEATLARARIAGDGGCGEDVVAIDSRVTLQDIPTGGVLTLEIVYPWAADDHRTRISILEPLSLSLLGHRRGEEVRASEDGPVVLRILRVHRAGISVGAQPLSQGER